MPTTLGVRIEEALDYSDMTVKDLEAALEKADVKGGSYANLHRLKSNKMERPSADLLYGIAKATGVRLGWLVAGEGRMTEQEEEKRLRGRYSAPDRALLEATTDRHPWLGQLTIGVQQTFMDVLRGLEFQTPGGRDLNNLDVEGVEQERIALADDLIFAVTFPLRLWGVPFPDLLREEATVSMEMPGPSVDVDGYLRQTLGALATVMTTRTPGDPLEERHQSLVAALRRVAEADQLPEEAEPSDEEQGRAARIQAALTKRLEERQQKLEEEGLGFEVESPYPDTQEEDDRD